MFSYQHNYRNSPFGLCQLILDKSYRKSGNFGCNLHHCNIMFHFGQIWLQMWEIWVHPYAWARSNNLESWLAEGLGQPRIIDSHNIWCNFKLCMFRTLLMFCKCSARVSYYKEQLFCWIHDGSKHYFRVLMWRKSSCVVNSCKVALRLYDSRSITLFVTETTFITSLHYITLSKS